MDASGGTRVEATYERPPVSYHPTTRSAGVCLWASLQHWSKRPVPDDFVATFGTVLTHTCSA
jgi:hypothetical protein